MKIRNLNSAVLLGISIALLTAGCATNTDLSQHSANTYGAHQLNQTQEVKTIEILSVLTARVAVDNTANAKRQAEVGAMMGAIIGAALGSTNKRRPGATSALGGAAGAGIGSAVGAATPTVIYQEGVTLTYVSADKTLSSTQVGKACEFKPGLAVMVKTMSQANETRIQPNSVCPEEKK